MVRSGKNKLAITDCNTKTSATKNYFLWFPATFKFEEELIKIEIEFFEDAEEDSCQLRKFSKLNHLDDSILNFDKGYIRLRS